MAELISVVLSKDDRHLFNTIHRDSFSYSVLLVLSTARDKFVERKAMRNGVISKITVTGLAAGRYVLFVLLGKR